MNTIVGKRETWAFVHGTDGSSKCKECGEFAVFPYQTSDEKHRIKLLRDHLDIHEFEGDEADRAVTRNKTIKKEFEQQVEKMGDLIEDE